MRIDAYRITVLRIDAYTCVLRIAIAYICVYHLRIDLRIAIAFCANYCINDEFLRIHKTMANRLRLHVRLWGVDQRRYWLVPT